MWNKIVKICGGLVILFVIDYIGLCKHFFELDYAYFKYPKDSFASINAIQYPFIHSPSAAEYEANPPLLLFLVKSAVKNTKQRATIRKTWGSKIANTQCVFLIGTSTEADDNQLIKEEFTQNKDIVQIDFLDTYYNNTIKTVMGLRWVSEFVTRVQFLMFVDDDYYVSIKHLLIFIKDYVKRYNTADMFVGFVMQTTPHRHKFSKWYIPLEEYPFNQWPPYITAGAYILSNATLNTLYKTSLSVPYFRFDDIYMGIVALKANVTLSHSDQFYLYRPTFNWTNNCEYVIASHGFSDASDLENVWKVCNIKRS